MVFLVAWTSSICFGIITGCPLSSNLPTGLSTTVTSSFDIVNRETVRWAMVRDAEIGGIGWKVRLHDSSEGRGARPGSGGRGGVRTLVWGRRSQGRESRVEAGSRAGNREQQGQDRDWLAGRSIEDEGWLGTALWIYSTTTCGNQNSLLNGPADGDLGRAQTVGLAR